MKVAVILAATATGWKSISTGENIAELKAQFKAIKVAGALQVGDETADCVVFLDSGGNMRRKQLNAPEVVAQRAAMRAKQEADAAALRAKQEAESDEGKAKAKAALVAGKVVDVIRQELTPTPEPEAAPGEPSAPVATDTTSDDDETPGDHFAGPSKKAPKRR